MKRTVLITRPEDDALPLAETLRARDLRVLIEPMLRIKPLRDLKIDIEGVQALLFTSSNGVRAFAALNRNRDLPVFTTGDASARVARSLGYKNVEGADGDVAGLVRLVRQRLKPEDGALFHAAGSVVAGDLASQLSDLGYTLRRDVVYEAVQADELSPQLLDRLEAGEVDMVLLFSPRTAETFLNLLRTGSESRPGLANALSKVIALCLSRAVADAARAGNWRRIEAADRPDLNAMLSLIERTTTALDAEQGVTSDGATGGGATAQHRPTDDRVDSVMPTTERRRGRWVWVASAIVVLFVVLAGLATMPAWRGLFGDRLADPTPAVTTPDAEESASDAPASDTMSDATESQAEEPATTEPAAPESAEPESATSESAVTETDGTAAETATDEPADMTDAAEPEADSATAESEGAAAETSETVDNDGEPAESTAAGADASASMSSADPRIDELLARLDAIEAAVEAGGDGSAGTAASEEALTALDERIAALEQAGGAADPGGEIASLNERVTAIEQLLIDFMTEVPAQSLADVKTEVQRLIDENEGLRTQLATLTERFEQADSTAFIMAVGRLGEALGQGRSFEPELSTLLKLAHKDPALAGAMPSLETLIPYSAEGAPSESTLTARFPSVARAIVQAAQQEEVGAAGGDSSWFDRLLGRLSETVTVRPVGDDVVGDDPASRVARAEARLAAGDLGGAVAEIEPMTGAPAEAAADWLADAKARLAVREAFATIDAVALDRLGDGAGDDAGFDG